MENEGTHVHSYTDTVVPPTCKEKGYTLHRCECGYEYRDSYKPAGPHSFEVIEEKQATCTENGSRTSACSVCGEMQTETLPAFGHLWGEWITEKHPTCTESGSQYRFCGRCGMREDRSVEATGHKLINPKPSETDKGVIEYFCENCGETVAMPAEEKPASKIKKVFTAVLPFLIVIAIAVTIFLIFLRDPFHYYVAKLNMHFEKYDSAVHHLKKCPDYKNADVLLNRFDVVYGKTVMTYYDEDGNIIGKLIEEYDEYGNKTKEVTYGKNGTVIESEYEYEHEYELDGDGNIKTESTDGMVIKFEYDDRNNVVRRIATDEYAEILSTQEYEFDKEDNMMRHLRYNRKGELRAEKIYDSFGHILYETGYEVVDGEVYKTSQLEYTYDEHGNLTKELRYGEYKELYYERTYEYEYDKKGRTVLKKIFDEDGKLSHKIKYEYDKNNRVVAVKGYDKHDELTDKAEFEYDKNGNMVLAKCISNDELKAKCKWEYDKKGNKTLATYHNEDGQLVCKITYEDPTTIYSTVIDGEEDKGIDQKDIVSFDLFNYENVNFINADINDMFKKEN